MESIESGARIRRRRPSGGECGVQGGDRTERSNPKDFEQALLARACDAKRKGPMPVCGCVLEQLRCLYIGTSFGTGCLHCALDLLGDAFMGYRYCTAPCPRVNRGERMFGLLFLPSS